MACLPRLFLSEAFQIFCYSWQQGFHLQRSVAAARFQRGVSPRVFAALRMFAIVESIALARIAAIGKGGSVKTNRISKVLSATLAVAISCYVAQASAQTSTAPSADVSAQRRPAPTPPHQTRSDAQLVRDVRRAFTRTTGLNSSGIHVTARHGIVTLTGWVSHRQQVDRAGNAARSVRGVRSVQNRLTVRTRHGSGSGR
ncbi:BON domain-containing protein [Paraburkholderia rhizosphaerae]|uniref:BON domain-containing protein n=3 Tax=Paraburkholderia rhizosphaerae TaxID=480658 RepID=A0A4R8L7Y0_9BURK|nr:BON domain-containing protein [Paraburkholderia rhizosphaerae]